MTQASIKLYSIYHGRFPGERAAALFAGKEAESFANTGAETTLLVPRRKGRASEDPHEYFGLKKNFQVVYLSTLDLFDIPILKRIAFPVSLIAFSIATFFYLLRTPKNSIIISNETLPIIFASFRFRKTVYEVHDFPEKKLWLYRILFRRTGLILATNQWKKAELTKRFHVPEKKIIVLPNGVDVEEFDIPIPKEEAREKLGLEQGKHYAVYTGHLYSWKGVDTLAQAAKLLPSSWVVLFVGGREEDIAAFQKRHGENPRIRLVGFRPHKEIPIWLKAADVLVLPNTAKEEISMHYTSPMKLFEYMASGRPIVASHIPSISEIVSEREVELVSPDHAHALFEGIQKAFASKVEDRLRREWLSKYHWRERSQRLLSPL